MKPYASSPKRQPKTEKLKVLWISTRACDPLGAESTEWKQYTPDFNEAIEKNCGPDVELQIVDVMSKEGNPHIRLLRLITFIIIITAIGFIWWARLHLTIQDRLVLVFPVALLFLSSSFLLIRRALLTHAQRWELTECLMNLSRAVLSASSDRPPDLLCGWSYAGGVISFAMSCELWRGPALLLAPSTALIAPRIANDVFEFPGAMHHSSTVLIVQGKYDTCVSEAATETCFKQFMKRVKAKVVTVDSDHFSFQSPALSDWVKEAMTVKYIEVPDPEPSPEEEKAAQPSGPAAAEEDADAVDLPSPPVTVRKRNKQRG